MEKAIKYICEYCQTILDINKPHVHDEDGFYHPDCAIAANVNTERK